MQDFEGKVAVVTGGASGIGLAMATRFAAEGMRLVLADIEEDVLEEAAAGLRETGAEVLTVQTDCGDAASMDNLAEESLAHYGSVHVVCNNAGVGARG
ncbi:MAG: SDR family NAD(P)-dependent oxidoreductase, partial [Dehalococcoidia bacterium]|nr:SDR family NAD(P)-dependent oxidoreductase [Dehalococcoidia bacterium]